MLSPPVTDVLSRWTVEVDSEKNVGPPVVFSRWTVEVDSEKNVGPPVVLSRWTVEIDSEKNVQSTSHLWNSQDGCCKSTQRKRLTL